MPWTTGHVLLMALLEQPNSSTTLTGFLLELRDRHQICCNLCKTAVPERNLGCLIHQPGKTTKGYQPRPCCFSRTFPIMAKICGSTICSDNKEHDFLYFLVDPPAPSLISSSPVTLQHVPGFAKCAPHTTGNNLLPSFALSSSE